jgi:hypothetical protein
VSKSHWGERAVWTWETSWGTKLGEPGAGRGAARGAAEGREGEGDGDGHGDAGEGAAGAVMFSRARRHEREMAIVWSFN